MILPKILLFFAGVSLLPRRGVEPPALPEARILLAARTAEYLAIASGFEAAYGGTTQRLVAEKQGPTLAELVESIVVEAPPLVVAVGGNALSGLLAARDRLPPATAVLYAGVLRPDLVFERARVPAAQAARFHGVSLDIPLGWKLRTTASLFPSLRRFGVVYAPASGNAEVADARRIAAQEKLELDARAADGTRDCVEAWRELFPRVDAIIFTAPAPCDGFESREIFDDLRKRSLSLGVPLVGLKASHVESAALVAFVLDYEEVGRQAARLASRRVAGEGTESELPIPAIRYVLRRDGAELYRMRIPGATVAGASRLVGGD